MFCKLIQCVKNTFVMFNLSAYACETSKLLLMNSLGGQLPENTTLTYRLNIKIHNLVHVCRNFCEHRPKSPQAAKMAYNNSPTRQGSAHFFPWRRYFLKKFQKIFFLLFNTFLIIKKVSVLKWNKIKK